MPRSFSGSVMLPKALVVNLDCLGQEFDGRTNDELFTLPFPRSGEDAELQPPKFHEPQWLDDDDGDPRMWGWMPQLQVPLPSWGWQYGWTRPPCSIVLMREVEQAMHGTFSQ